MCNIAYYVHNGHFCVSAVYSAKMNKLFDQFRPPEEDVSQDNNVDDLDSFEELNSVSLSDEYDDDGETEVFDTSSSVSDYEPDSTTHLPKN